MVQPVAWPRSTRPGGGSCMPQTALLPIKGCGDVPCGVCKNLPTIRHGILHSILYMTGYSTQHYNLGLACTQHTTAHALGVPVRDSPISWASRCSCLARTSSSHVMDQMLVAVDRNKMGAVLLKLDIVLLLLLHACSDLTGPTLLAPGGVATLQLLTQFKQ
jgi:hypothetical protein